MVKYVALYWTLPVLRYGFTRLPRDIEQAAERSTMIRYQRALARNHAQQTAGRLIAEKAYLSQRSDMLVVSEAFRDEMRQWRPFFDDLVRGDAILLLVISYQFGWRPSGQLIAFLEQSGIEPEHIEPTPLLLHGKLFGPETHFNDWRDRDAAFRASTLETSDRHLLDAAGAFAGERGLNGKVAERLNALGIQTLNGKSWTADNVRKRLSALGGPALR